MIVTDDECGMRIDRGKIEVRGENLPLCPPQASTFIYIYIYKYKRNTAVSVSDF
jgi:hypothetical protein